MPLSTFQLVSIPEAASQARRPSPGTMMCLFKACRMTANPTKALLSMMRRQRPNDPKLARQAADHRQPAGVRRKFVLLVVQEEGRARYMSLPVDIAGETYIIIQGTTTSAGSYVREGRSTGRVVVLRWPRRGATLRPQSRRMTVDPRDAKG